MSVAVAPRSGQMLLELERRILDAEDRHDVLAQKLQSLREELCAVDTEVDGLVAQLRATGRRRVDMGDLRRTSPLSPLWGTDRGLPIDRHYIHAFLDRHRHHIAGRVLEVKDPGYARMFGDSRVATVDVLDVDELNPKATIVADLSRADVIPSDTYDCFILTQTLGVIFDVAGAIRHALRVLKPGGVLLCSLPAAGRLSHEEGLDGDFWRFTEASVRHLFGDVLPRDAFEISAHGNVLAGVAFLYGLAAHELSPAELNVKDPYLPLVYTVCAVKPFSEQTLPDGHQPTAAGSPTGSPKTGRPGVRRERPTSCEQPAQVKAPQAVVLAYHRIAEPAHAEDHLSISPLNFRAQLERLRAGGYQVMPLRELVVGARCGELAGNAVALTFDDGYADALDSAAPILESFGCPATFFVVGAALDATDPFWWDTLDALFGGGARTPTRLALSLPDGPIDLVTATAAERRLAHDRLAERLHSLDPARREAAVRALRAWAGPQGATSMHRPMTTDQLTHLAGCTGMTIGAHAWHHERLPSLSPQARVDDLRRCRTRLEALIGTGVTALSYPYGATDDDTAAAAREAGFTLAVTTTTSAVTRNSRPRFVPRTATDLGTVLAAL
jgi:peptidoglycan/xylan/chitin deacetylase (PgdA/CDA1 family)/SAM-dependent methyltransferase